jgi:hypothetical protein
MATQRRNIQVLQSAEFVAQCAAYARKNYDPNIAGAEMLKHGYALMSGLPLDVADRAVQSMLSLHDAFGGNNFVHPNKEA